jgi:hypothetical protein
MTYVDSWQEHCDYEANAQYDYIREAYAYECDETADNYYDHAHMVQTFGPWIPVPTSADLDIPF